METVKRAGLVALVVVSAVLAIMVGKRMSPDAAAMLIGVVAGFLAGLPATLILALWIGKRRQRDRAGGKEQPATPVVIVAPGSTSQSLPGGVPWASLFPQEGFPGGERHFVQDEWGYDDPQA